MDLKTEILADCNLCGHTGVLGTDLCECTLKFRAMNRMVDTGFNMASLWRVSGDYHRPEIESGKKYLDYYQTNFEDVEAKGLFLYIYSREKGRGKTTLAHRLIYLAARYFAHTSRYRRYRDYGFARARGLFKDAKKGDESWKAQHYVLDDLGAEDRSSDWVRGDNLSFMQEFLHYRRDKFLPTIITSNYNPADLSGLYEGVLDSLLEIRPDGAMGGNKFRPVEVGGGEDLRLLEESQWPL